MNRRTLLVILLAVASGCLAVEPDPINEYPYPSLQRPPGKSASGSMSKRSLWSDADGNPLPLAYSDGVVRPYGSTANATKAWSNQPQSKTAAAKSNNSSGSTSTATAAKSSAPRPTAKTDKNDDVIVKASYTESKAAKEKTTSVATAAKPLATKTPAAPAEAESPPVNLGLLRLINGKRISIRYAVKDPASVGVADLEIWGTTDLRTWKKYNVASRSSSSLMVDVKGEGLYGFTVLARAKGDQTRNQPPVGEPPQMWVAVDFTKPVVQLLSTESNNLAQAPALTLRWKATDRNLGPRPITLLYAERPEGPWVPLAANLENSGHYQWVPPAHVPAEVCVRVQATDLMGNIGLAQSAPLRIPGRFASSTPRTGPTLDKPIGLAGGSSLTNPRPLAAQKIRPTVSILSVEGQ